jgi:hypothetical protein
MSAEKIKAIQISKYKEYVPEEFTKSLMTGELEAIGGFFGDDPAGTLIFEKVRGKVIIRSIYTAPEFRRLGVATDMFELLPKGEICVSYEAVDDKVTLEPFFEAMDVELERLDVPLADFTLGKARDSLKKAQAQRAGEYGIFLDELKSNEENIVFDWFKDEFSEGGLDGTSYDSSSLFYVENNKVKGAIFLRKDEATDYDIIQNGPDSPPPDILDIDYIFCESSNKKVLPGMMNKLVERLSAEHKDNTRIQGLIMPETGEELYNSLFGEVMTYVPVLFT